MFLHPVFSRIWILLLLSCAAALAPLSAGAETTPTDPTGIVGLTNDAGTATSPDLSLAMRGKLAVELDGTKQLDATKWVLYLNGQPITDLATTVGARHSLVFTLRRTEKNENAWANILASPTWTREIDVAVSNPDVLQGQRLTGASGHAPRFTLNILWTVWLIIAIVVAVAGVLLLCLTATRTAMLRDNILPQIPARQRAFSLGRCQMAFWFAMVLITYLFLWTLMWDYNTVTQSALVLMGIAAATGLGAIAAGTSNRDALDQADKDLRAAGFTSPADIETLLADLKANPGDAALKSRKAVYDAATKDYFSNSYDPGSGRYDNRKIWLDLISDKDGPALHRLQVACWTLVLGLVFLVTIYQDLSMPEFSTTLLALMGVSGASYVGFKFPEKT